MFSPALARTRHALEMIQLPDAVATVSSTLMEQIERVLHENTSAGPPQVKNAQVEVAEMLFEEKVPAPEIQGLLTQINNGIYHHILRRLLKDMEEEGCGKPPVGFCAIVMGSGGRGESFLLSDQDNGFILEDYPDPKHSAVDPFFIELAERMTRALGKLGFTLCRGHVMATNPLWRKTLPQWRRQIRCWLCTPNILTLRLLDIFFDFQSVFGESELADSLRNGVAHAVQRQHSFLCEMQRAQTNHGVALGLFGRLAPDRSRGPDKRELNLKYHGLLPLVEAIRLLALREGIRETSTLSRIAALHSKGVLDANERDCLIDGFHHLTKLLLRQQISDFKAGRDISVHVPLGALCTREKRALKDTLRVINNLRNRIRMEFTANLLAVSRQP